MKNKLLLLAFISTAGACLLSGAKAQAQSVFNTNDSHVWYTYYNEQTWEPTTIVHYFTLVTNADTIINSTNYKKIYYESKGYFSIDTARLAYCARYDSTQQNVYAVFKDSINEYLFYKFNLQVGDTLHDLVRMSKYNSTGFYTSTFIVHEIEANTQPQCSKITLYDTNTNSSLFYSLNWWKGVGGDCIFENEITPSPVGGTGLYLGCTSDTTHPCYYVNCKNLNLYTLLPKQNEQQEVLISYNTITQILNIDTPHNIDNLIFTNTNGLIINVNTHLEHINSTNYTLNVSGITQGLYIIQIISKGKVYNKKVIIFNN